VLRQTMLRTVPLALLCCCSGGRSADVLAPPSNAITGVLHYTGGAFNNISLRGACVTGKGRAAAPQDRDAWVTVPGAGVGGPSMFAGELCGVSTMQEASPFFWRSSGRHRERRATAPQLPERGRLRSGRPELFPVHTATPLG
jgi:hypothetical protein